MRRPATAQPFGPGNPHPLSTLKPELVWEGKYDEFGNRREGDAASLTMPLRRIETVDEPRARAEAQGRLFDALRTRRVDLPVWLHYLEGAAKGAFAAEGTRAESSLSVSFDDSVRCTRCGTVVLEKDARYFAPQDQAGASPYCADCNQRLRLSE